MKFDVDVAFEKNLRSMQACEKFLTLGDKFEVKVGILSVKGGI